MEPELVTANELIDRLNTLATVYNDASWSLEQTLHNLRLNAIGSSGIQHRVIQDRAGLLVQLKARMDTAKKILDERF